jgi:exodeoxyribonuclease V beta subunit
MLLATSPHAADSPDRDTAFFNGTSEPELEIPPAGTAGRRDMFSFPGGSRAGTFFHAVLEEVDFSLGRHPANKAVIDRKLPEFGFDAAWSQTVLRMIAEIASVPIAGIEAGLLLKRLAPEDCIHEMEFYHPLKPVTPGLLRRVFERFGLRKAIRGFPERLGRLAFAPARGFMKGYIDMVAYQEGRFFLADWKSNYLGDGFEHYHVSKLIDPMRNEFYILQYHIYTLALHLYLRQRVAGYDYQRHFGGVGYVFIRGVDRSRGAEFGIYSDRPETDLIHALGEALVPGYE